MKNKLPIAKNIQFSQKLNGGNPAKISRRLVFIAAAIILILIFYRIIIGTGQTQNKLNETIPGNPDPETVCRSKNGKWLDNYRECEGAAMTMTAQECADLKGNYEECASSCRHQPTTGSCIALCIKVCSFQ